MKWLLFFYRMGVLLSLILMLCFWQDRESVFAFSSQTIFTLAPYTGGYSIQAADNIWYTGIGDEPHNFLIKHWDGKQFQSPENLPDSAYQRYDMGEGTLALSKKDVWVIGTGTSDKHPLRMYHFDGRGWDEFPEPIIHGETIYALAAVSTHDIWAVGQYNALSDGLNKTLVIHWDGKAWQHVNSPNVTGVNSSLWSVSVRRSDDIWAAGSIESVNGGDLPLIEHWDGKSWNSIASPTIKSFGGRALNAITALTQNDVWVVGAEGLIEHWDGKTWKVVVNPSAGQYLTAINAYNAHDIWAVGLVNQQCDNNGICTSSPLVEHWDGKAWQRVEGIIAPSHNNAVLIGIRVFSSKNIWMIGKVFSQIFLEYWDGKMWKIVAECKLF